MKRRRSSNMSGFTLLEVLISTVLLASVYVGVVALSSQSLRNLTRMQPHEMAMIHAREKMNQVLLLEELLPGISTGAWEDGYRWEARKSPNVYNPKPAPNSSGLFDVRVAVFWGDAPTQKSYVLETTVLETTQSAKRARSNGSR